MTSKNSEFFKIFMEPMDPMMGGEGMKERWMHKNMYVKKAVGILLLIFVLVVLWKLGERYGGWGNADFPATSSSQWQAVFLDNNQVYFGHVTNYDRGYATLTNVYYLQVTQPLQPQNPNQPPTLNLVKLGNELHGPEDVMYIPKDKILFWENMKPDSQVVQAIESTRK